MGKINMFDHRIILMLIALSVFGLSCKKDKQKEPDADPVKLKNVVYVGSEDHNFYALNSSNGNQIWKYTGTGGFSYSDPVVYKGTVYAGSTDGNMYAFDSETGAVQWKYFAGSDGIESSPAVADGIIYFGSNDHNFYALNAQNGQLLWEFATTENVSSSPKVVNGIVYFGSSDNYIYALNAKTGSLVWRYEALDMINQSSPAINNGVVFIGSRDGYLYALNAANGQLKWKYYGGGSSFEMSSPVIAGGLVYIGGWMNIYDPSNTAQGAFYAIDETSGNLAWKSLNRTGISGDPMVSNNKAYISADDGNFHAFNSKDGTSLWTVEILPNSAGSALANGLVFVGGGGTGDFYAIDENTGNIKWKNPDIRGLLTSTPCVVDANGTIIHR
jgi:outer membrane protein assembly factor BamB